MWWCLELNNALTCGLIRVQHQVKVFDQFLKHRKPKLSQHMVSVCCFVFCFILCCHSLCLYFNPHWLRFHHNFHKIKAIFLKFEKVFAGVSVERCFVNQLYARLAISHNSRWSKIWCQRNQSTHPLWRRKKISACFHCTFVAHFYSDTSGKKCLVPV